MHSAYQTYQTTAVQTATPQELSLMLYNGCLKFIKLANKALAEGNIEQKHINLIKAQAIISQFRITLDMDVPISENLDSLYEFINQQLVEANTTNDQAKLAVAEELVTELRDTWKTMMKTAASV